MVSMSPKSSSPALAYCHSCFLISQKQSSVTETVYLACLPQPGKEKKGGKKQTHKPGSQHKIILHNTRQFKEALPILPPHHHHHHRAHTHTPLFALMKKKERVIERKGGGGDGVGVHIRRKLLFAPQSHLGLLIIVFRVQQLGC